jgi:hypothetical protein
MTPDLARIIHEAWRAYDNAILKNPGPDSPWDTLPQWKKTMLIRYAEALREGYGPESAHEILTECYDAQGADHLLARPWCDLPAEQRKKGLVAIAIVRNFG